MIPRPIEFCYWVEPGKLLAGEYPRDIDSMKSIVKMKAFINMGISAFIDLTHTNDRLAPYIEYLDGARHYSFPVKDVSIPDSIEQTISILDTIDMEIHRGGLVYVHCWGGSGRTGLIIGCWLARHGLGGPAALERLKKLWEQCPKSKDRRSPDNMEQARYIMNWKVDQ